jgi:hypothetical protein
MSTRHRPRNPVDATVTAVITLYLVTLVHHLYGGIVFASTERLVLSLIFTVGIVATVALHRLGSSRRWARWTYWSLVALWITVIGIIEGGYNHTLFVTLKLLGAGPEIFQQLYPDGIDGVESSSDILFQGTGVLTFLAIIPILIFAIRARPRRTGPTVVRS